MEFLKKLGFTNEEITNLATLTEEQQTEAIDRVKKTIEDNVRNDKTLFEEYTKKGKDEAYIIALKKIGKVLGVKHESDDTIDTLLEKGKVTLTANTEKEANKLLDELNASKAEITRLTEEVIPSEVSKVRSEVNKVYIDTSINSTLSSEEFKEYLLAENHRPNIYRSEIEALGGEFKYDPTTGKTKLVQKENGLKFQMKGVTYEETDLLGPAKVILEPYAKKSNGGAEPGAGGQGGTPKVIAGAGGQGGKSILSAHEQELEFYAKLEQGLKP